MVSRFDDDVIMSASAACGTASDAGLFKPQQGLHDARCHAAAPGSRGAPSHGRPASGCAKEVTMRAADRRRFLKASAATAAWAALPLPVLGGDGAERQVRPAHPQRQRARSRPAPFRPPRHRHPLRPGGGDRADHRRRARRARPRCRRQAGDAGADRPALPHLPLRVGHRHPGRRAGRASVHHHRGLGRRRRRQQLRRLPALHRPGVTHAAVRVRAHRRRRARGLSGSRAFQHRLRRCPRPRPASSPRTPTWCSA